MLINRMNNAKCKHSCAETQNYLHSIGQTNKETLKNIGCPLECGYIFLTVTLKNTLTALCKYLNLWLDAQKSIPVNDNSNVNKEDWQIVEDLWTRLKEKQDASLQCKREHEEKDISDYSKRIELMSYCINRDYFKRLFHSSGRSDGYKEEMCKSFSDYTREYYAKLIKGIKCIDNKNNNIDYKYHISEDCTLYNIPKTFPKCEAHNPTFLENDNSKKNIICETNAIVESVGTESDENLDEPLKRDDAPAKLPERAGDPAESPKAPSDPVKLPEAGGAPAGITELYLPSLTDVTSLDNGISKPIYYAGLSVSGVFFTSMVLYKYTTLGSFIRSLVSNKEKLRQTTNKHLAQQWLETTSEYMDPNSENAQYNFPYHSMQN